jgi:hypothetical protein
MKPERCNLDHRSEECGGNLTHRIGSELILDNWCRANVRLLEKEKGPQVTDPVTKLWIVTRQSDDRIFDKARIARER